MCGWLSAFMMSSIGMKHAMAVTGALLSGFIVAHMSGNLLIFAGPEALNKYAAGMQSLGPLLWVARAGLLAILCGHLFFAARLNIINRSARPIPYAKPNSMQLTFASKTMPYTGALIFFFILYHLAHFTLQIVNKTEARLDALGQHDVYFMVVSGFQNPVVAAIYILSMVVMGLHVSHGVSSVFQTFGLNHNKYNLSIKWLGLIWGWGVALGNISMVIAAFIGILKLA